MRHGRLALARKSVTIIGAGGRDVDEDLRLLADGLLRIQGAVVAGEDLAVRQRHRKLEGLALRVALARPRRRRSPRPGERRNRRRTAWRFDSWFSSLAPTEHFYLSE